MDGLKTFYLKAIERNPDFWFGLSLFGTFSAKMYPQKLEGRKNQPGELETLLLTCFHLTQCMERCSLRMMKMVHEDT